MNLTLQHVTTSNGIEITVTDAHGDEVAGIVLTPLHTDRLLHILHAARQWWVDDMMDLSILTEETCTEPSPANHEPE